MGAWLPAQPAPMMVDRDATVVVTSDETLPGVIERLGEAARGGRTAHLIVPIDSSLLLTANEFRRLKDAVDERRIPVVLRTADPLRLHLGERLGLRVQAAPRPKRPVAVSAQASARPVAPELPRGPEPPDDATVQGPRPTVDPHAPWPGLNGASDGPDDGEVNADQDQPVEQPRSVGPANPPRRWLPVAALLTLLVMAAVLAIRFAIPRATVRIVPRTESVSATLVFDVTADGRPLDEHAAFALQPKTQAVDVVWDGSAPATGVRVVPDGTAAGPIELRNASSEPLTVDAGAVVVTEEGTEFEFVEELSVPAADPATGEPGKVTGSVRAVAAGSGGNVETGFIGGRLPNGVYYSNRMEPTSGGTDKEFPVVAQEDLDALSAAAREAADELAAMEVAQGDSSMDVRLSSAKVQDQHDIFDHQVDEEVDAVALQSEMTVQVTFYDGGAAEDAYKPALAQQLAAAAPDGFWVDPERIVFEPPREAEERDGGTRLEVSARVDAEAKLDDAERRALAERLAGASAEDARAILANVEEAADVIVEYEPSWLPQQMPNNAGRITFEVAH